MAHKLINGTDSPLEIRLVKRNNASVGLRNDILPDGAVNNTTEFTFKLGADASYEHIVLAHADTPNLVNPSEYITNGDLFTLTDGANSAVRTVNANVRLTDNDPNFATKKLGIFYKVRASDAIYVLGDKPNSPAPVTYRVIKGSKVTTMAITDIMASKGAYFEDQEYYVPLFLGTLKDLQDTWLAGQAGAITFTPHTTLGANEVRNEVAIVKIIPATGITITNTEYLLTKGSTLAVKTSIAPLDADVTSLMYSATPSTVATVADPLVPNVSVIGSGEFAVTAHLVDGIGQQFQATKEFYGILNIEPYVVQLAPTAGARTASVKMQGTAAGQSVDINWGDGTVETVSDVAGKTVSHTYATDGQFQARFYISGEIESIQHNPQGTEPTILQSVVAWGSVNVKGFQYTDSVGLTGVPIVAPTNITSMEGMFSGCTNFNGNIAGWYVGNVTNFKNAFKNASTFNQALGSWTVSSATTFESMFEGAASFNQYLANWSTLNATTMKNMFSGAKLFNADISKWNVSKVTDFSGMFKNAQEFNQALASWNVSAGTTFESMFQQAYSFDKPIGSWDVSNAKSLNYMFAGDIMQDTWFNQDISSWDVSGITSMDGFLSFNSRFSQDLRWWCVSQIASRPTDFAMVGGAMQTQYEPVWGLCPIRDTAVTIVGLPTYLVVGDVRTLSVELDPTQPIQGVVWSTDNPNVVNLSADTGELMFLAEGSATITAVVNGLYTGTKVITVNGSLQPFTFTTSANATVSITNPTAEEITVDWGDGTRVTLPDTTFTHTYTDGVAHSVKVSITSIDLPSLTVAGGVTEVTSWYGGNQPSVKFGNDVVSTQLAKIPSTVPTGWNDAEYMFQNCPAFNQDICGWDVSAITSFRGMFKNATAFNQNISGWDVSLATNMDEMFHGAAAFNQDIVLWCVSGIAEAPTNFATGATSLNAAYIPVWGTCPNRNLVVNIVADKTTLGLGLKTRLGYTTTPEITVTDEAWSVDDSTILSVSTRGLVTAKALGSTYVNLVLNKTYRTRLRITATEASFDAEVMVLDVDVNNANEALYIQNNSSAGGFEVDYGDGTGEIFVEGNVLRHAYAETGKYYVQITPIDAQPLNITLGETYSRVLQWSSVGYEHLVLSSGNYPSPYLIDVPTTEPKGLTSYRGMFQNAYTFNDDLSGWNTSAITDMAYMFNNAYAFNGNISTWNTGLVTDMNRMFTSAHAFNTSIVNWNVATVESMQMMFNDARAFNQDISAWNVGSVTNMGSMFENALSFTADLSWWCVSKIAVLPENFRLNASYLTDEKLPVWGTCPNRSYGLTIDNPGSLKVTRTEQMVYNLTPATNVVSTVWTSSNDAIATVNSNGVVVGISEGTVTINLAINRVYVASVTFEIIPNVEILAPTNLTIVNLESPTNLTAEVEFV